MTFPTAAQQAGNFPAWPAAGIYDPFIAGRVHRPQHQRPLPLPVRLRTWRAASVQRAIPSLTGAPVDVIPASQFSTVALKLQSFLPAGIGTPPQNNYISPNPDWPDELVHDPPHRLHHHLEETRFVVAAIGRQASSNPTGQTTAGRNVGPIPYNYGQTFAPKTAVGVIEETHVFSPHLINQFKYGYARYNGPRSIPTRRPPMPHRPRA